MWGENPGEAGWLGAAFNPRDSAGALQAFPERPDWSRWSGRLTSDGKLVLDDLQLVARYEFQVATLGDGTEPITSRAFEAIPRPYIPPPGQPKVSGSDLYVDMPADVFDGLRQHVGMVIWLYVKRLTEPRLSKRVLFT